MSDSEQWWLMYIRYQTGRLGVVRATEPRDVALIPGVIVCACVPVARVTAQAHSAWPVRASNQR